MSVYLQNKQFFDKPIFLSEDQRANPEALFTDFFIDYHLYESREYLAALLDCALTSHNSHFGEASSRDAIRSFTANLEQLIEAAYVINSKA